MAAAVALASACATAPARSSNGLAASSGAKGANAELSALRTQQLEQIRRIGELEARLSLLEADARRAREADGASLRAGETVRIGSERASGALAAAEADTTDEAGDGDSVDDKSKRPSLRLYGNERDGAGAQRTAASLPPVPSVSERLPVVPLPEQRAAKAMRPASAAQPAAAVEQYRKGLRMLHERHYDQALALFDAFVTEHPTHALVPSALYWRGEARYAKRDYGGARREFEALLTRFPKADHAPDALFKLGLSWQKLGSDTQAKDAFERLRSDYPKSQAAQAAAREGST